MAEGRKKLMVIDDELGRELLVQLFEDDYDVVTVTQGGTALEQVRTEQPDLILLEPVLPLLDGLGLASQVRQIETLREVPILAVTAAGMPDDEERAREAGCNDFIIKPIDEEDLRERIQRFLGD